MSITRYQLDTEKVVDTVRKLLDRIGDRFPESGLRRQAEELVRIGERARSTIAWISRPNWILRISIYLLIIAIAAGVIAGAYVLFTAFDPKEEGWTFGSIVELIEAGTNDIVLFAIGIFFLITIETRIKRRRALNALHELRSIAHVIDMHQLTKDPDRIFRNRSDTSHSPKSDMTAFQLRRYLDYCSEMLSLTSKIASTYIQNFDDSATAATVNEIENLTTGLSRKIWQKIMIIQEISAHDLTDNATPNPPPPPSGFAPSNATTDSSALQSENSGQH